MDRCRWFPLVTVALVCWAAPVAAHEFGAGQTQYEDFLSGNRAVLTDIPLLLGLIAAGLYAAIWRGEGIITLWLPLAIGLVAGTALGFSGLVPPVIPAWFAVMVLGLFGAAKPDVPIHALRGIYLVAGILFTNTVFSGHTVEEIPLFAYVGIAFAINLVVLACAGMVQVSLEKLPYGWVMIAWRAGMSWLVAIAVMAVTLSMA